MIIQSACKPPCTPDFHKALPYHDLMKYDIRISVKDHRRRKNLKLQMAQLSYSSSRQFSAKMNGSLWPSDGRPGLSTEDLRAVRRLVDQLVASTVGEPETYGEPLTDEDITAAARVTFATLDADESKANRQSLAPPRLCVSCPLP
jgi:hypothetical protein